MSLREKEKEEKILLLLPNVRNVKMRKVLYL